MFSDYCNLTYINLTNCDRSKVKSINLLKYAFSNNNIIIIEM